MRKPSPFCILDEIDAPLDDKNVERFKELVNEFAHTTQFIIITHNKQTMHLGNTIYGMTMEDQGVSRAVSIRLDEIDDSDTCEGNGTSAGGIACLQVEWARRLLRPRVQFQGITGKASSLVLPGRQKHASYGLPSVGPPTFTVLAADPPPVAVAAATCATPADTNRPPCTSYLNDDWRARVPWSF